MQNSIIFNDIKFQNYILFKVRLYNKVIMGKLNAHNMWKYNWKWDKMRVKVTE